MSRYRKYRSSKRSLYSDSSNYERYHTSSSYTDSLRFVRNEFFHFNEIAFNNFVGLYSSKYGDGAAQYLRRTYNKWRSKATNMSGQTEKRILQCVPPFMTKEKQFKLLSYQIPTIINQQRRALRSSSINLSDMINAYRKLSLEICQNQYKMDWFVKEIFPPAELEEFFNVLKFTMADCLRLSYSHVLNDLLIIKDILPYVDGSIKFYYNISLLQCDLEIDHYPPRIEDQLTIPMPTPRLVTQFRDQYRTIILDHALTQCRLNSIDEVNRQIAINDIRSSIAKLRRINPDQEYDFNFEVKGFGGSLRIIMQRVNMVRLKYSIIKQVFKIAFSICIAIMLAGWIISKNNILLLAFLCLAVFVVVGVSWGKLRELQKEVKEYEQNRAARFTAH